MSVIAFPRRGFAEHGSAITDVADLGVWGHPDDEAWWPVEAFRSADAVAGAGGTCRVAA